MKSEMEFSSAGTSQSVKQFYNAFIFNIEIDNDSQTDRSAISSFPPPNSTKKSTRISSLTKNEKSIEEDTNKSGCCGCFSLGKKNPKSSKSK